MNENHSNYAWLPSGLSNLETRIKDGRPSTYFEPPLTVMRTATVCWNDSNRYVEGQLSGSKGELYC